MVCFLAMALYHASNLWTRQSPLEPNQKAFRVGTGQSDSLCFPLLTPGYASPLNRSPEM